MKASGKNLITGKHIVFAIFVFIYFIPTSAQQKVYTYRPQNQKQDTVKQWPSVTETPDTNNFQREINQDSINAREAYVRDSIAKREAFIRDSIAIREAFVRDSIAKRKRILDSLNFLKNSLPNYIEASLKTSSEDIIVDAMPVQIIGDSILSDYNYNKLIFNLSKPYTPWNESLNLSTNPIKFKADPKAKNIVYIKFPSYTHKYTYNAKQRILRIDENSIILSKRYGKLYNIPVDSVFYDNQGRITKIKKYNHYYEVVGNYQKGGSMYLHLKQVKQFEYAHGKTISRIEMVNFCDRWRKLDPQKVCNIITYSLQKNGNNYSLTRKHDPENTYSDGKFTFEFGENNELKSVEFKNEKNSEDWRTIVELNENGNVSRYVYINKDKVNQTLLINYFDDPKAKHKVETISCFFEDDRISYQQKNNTTGKSRIRDRLTMEWGPWQ